MDSSIIIAILSGGTVAGIVSVIGTYITTRQKHLYEKDDKEDKDVKALKEAMKYLLMDRIQHLGARYLRQGEISLDDRRLLNNMHDSYHNGLGGNGDLDVLMEQVNDLPLKV